MQHLFEKIQRQLQAFVDQRDDVLAVASCTDEDTAFLLQLLRGIEQASEDDVLILLGDPFEDAESWADTCVSRLQEELEIANGWLEEQQQEPLPGLPDEVTDRQLPASERLFEAMMHLRALVPREGGRRLIWVMAPFSIKDRAAFLELLAPFVPGPQIEPWMRQGIRVIVRDQPLSRIKAPRTRLMPLDLGPEALEAAMEQDIMNESLPAEERMQALMMTAMQDYAHGRKGDALEKNELLLGHYQGTEDLPMQALVLNNIGDIHRKDGDLDQARAYYESAVPPASSGESPVLFHTVVKNLADVVYEQGEFPMAEECYTNADQLAGALCDAEAKARDLEGQGLCREQQGSLEQATESWEGAVQLCHAMGEMDYFLKIHLRHLARVYEQLRESKKLAEVKQQLSQLSQPGGTA